jgi:hypothetical protein
LLLAAPPAHAAFPGKNGKIVFRSLRADPNPAGCGICNYELFKMNPDGTDVTRLTNNPGADWAPAWSADGTKIVFKYNNDILVYADGTGQVTTGRQGSEPSWSPDGTKIVFSQGGLYTMNPDGTGVAGLTNHGPPDIDEGPVWSPDGSKIAFSRRSGNSNWADLYTINPNGTGETRITDNSAMGERDVVPDWSPDGTKLVFSGFGGGGSDADIYEMNADGTGKAHITSGTSYDTYPAWSPDGTKIAFTRRLPSDTLNTDIYVMDADGSGQMQVTSFAYGDLEPDWQPLQTYPRPKGASPLRISLVPAYASCNAPNRTHGAPLAYGSCTPPSLASGQLATGTPDSNGLPVQMDAFVLLRVALADVKIDAYLNDVRNKNLSPYTGSLRASLSAQVTDKNNVTSGGSVGAGTTQTFSYGFNVPCIASPDPQTGADCTITTTADTLVPGTILEGKRSIWEIGGARVDDAGPDGNPDTTADNTVFAVQGVFIP